MKQNRKSKHQQDTRRSYALPLPPVLITGCVASALFYGLIVTGPLDFEFLRRYCLSHAVAIASVTLFYIGLAGLLFKWYQASQQMKLAKQAATAMRRIITDGEDVSPVERPSWLQANLLALPTGLQHSWFGARVERVLDLQIQRGRRSQLETDLRALGEADADQQHESLSLLRIINWAMPMLGFLGTVLGISKTLGQLDTQMLATEQQEAMNQLTAGLYVAFDTTAIALILTVVSMFIQFGVSRLETNLLSRIDRDAGDTLIGFVGVDPADSQATLLAPVREMTRDLVVAIEGLVETQAAVWARSISESQRQWRQWAEGTCESAEIQLGEKLGEQLDAHAEKLKSIHEESNSHADRRAQQWQTTLSDQSRLAQAHQREICKQTEALHEQTQTLTELVSKVTDLESLEQTIQQSVSRLENVERIEKATQCVGEAVAVLATNLERAGVFRSMKRPRPARSVEQSSTEHAADPATDDGLAISIESRRKAA